MNQLLEIGLNERDLDLILEAIKTSSLSDSNKLNLTVKLEKIQKDLSSKFINPNQLELIFED